MRKRLIKTIFDYWEGNHPGADWDDAEWDHGKLADAILAALPSMVQPLEWEWDCDQPSVTDSIGAGVLYRVLARHSGKGSLRINSMNREHSEHDTPEKAKDAAEAHNVRTIMAAFGIEVSHE